MRMTKMWHRDLTWTSDFRKITLIDLLDAGLLQTFSVKKKSNIFKAQLKETAIKWGMLYFKLDISFSFKTFSFLMCPTWIPITPTGCEEQMKWQSALHKIDVRYVLFLSFYPIFYIFIVLSQPYWIGWNRLYVGNGKWAVVEEGTNVY